MNAIEIVFCALAAIVNGRFVRPFRLAWLAMTLWTTVSFCSDAAEAVHLFDWMPAVEWVRAAGIVWFVVSAIVLTVRTMWRKSNEVDQGRRRLLRAGIPLAVAPAAALPFAIHKAHQEAEIREVELPVANLPKDLEGLKIVQISDIHLSPFYSREELRRVVDQANGLDADLGLITGDLITSYGDPLQAAVRELSRLRARSGLYGCMGNHEIVAQAEEEAARLGRLAGIRFLRSEAEVLRFGKAELNLAGVDYQRKHLPYLAGTEALIKPGMTNLLLSHNPDVFPVAAKQGWDATLAGHTHGGQVQLEYLHPSLNPARFYTPFVYGKYQLGQAAMFVTSGIGTVGIPARLGTSPEIAMIRLVNLEKAVECRDGHLSD